MNKYPIILLLFSYSCLFCMEQQDSEGSKEKKSIYVNAEIKEYPKLFKLTQNRKSLLPNTSIPDISMVNNMTMERDNSVGSVTSTGTVEIKDDIDFDRQNSVESATHDTVKSKTKPQPMRLSKKNKDAWPNLSIPIIPANSDLNDLNHSPDFTESIGNFLRDLGTKLVKNYDEDKYIIDNYINQLPDKLKDLNTHEKILIHKAVEFIRYQALTDNGMSVSTENLSLNPDKDYLELLAPCTHEELANIIKVLFSLPIIHKDYQLYYIVNGIELWIDKILNLTPQQQLNAFESIKKTAHIDLTDLFIRYLDQRKKFTKHKLIYVALNDARTTGPINVLALFDKTKGDAFCPEKYKKSETPLDIRSLTFGQWKTLVEMCQVISKSYHIYGKSPEEICKEIFKYLKQHQCISYDPEQTESCALSACLQTFSNRRNYEKRPHIDVILSGLQAINTITPEKFDKSEISPDEILLHFILLKACALEHNSLNLHRDKLLEYAHIIYCVTKPKRCVSLGTINTLLAQNSKKIRLKKNKYNIWTLDLKDRKFNDIEGFEHIPEVQKINILNVSTNKLTYIPHAISYVQNLVLLDISENQLKELPDELQALTALKIIFAYSNRFSAIPDVVFELPSLEEVNFASNNIDVLPDGLGKLTKLELLNMAHNKISEVPNTISNLQSLTAISLLYNSLETIPDLTMLPSLKEIKIDKSSFKKNRSSFNDDQIENINREDLERLQTTLQSLALV